MQGRRRAPLELRRPGLVLWTIALGIVALDQLTKALVRASFAPGESLTVIPGVLHLTYVRNVGAAFGLLPGARPLFITTSLFVLFVVAVYWIRYRPRPWPLVVGLALVCSGAVGNLIDRALAGRVTDFFDLAFMDFPVFNIADSAIVIGVGVLTGWLLLSPDPDGDDPEVEVEVHQPVDADTVAGRVPSDSTSDAGDVR